MKNRAVKIAWAYAVEIFLAILLVSLGCAVIGPAAFAKLVRLCASDLATLYCGVFLAAALGFLGTLLTKADAEFYIWLDEIKSLSVFMKATAYVVFIEAAAVLILLGTKLFTGNMYLLIATFVFFMAVINSYTLIANVINLVRLQSLYSRLSKKN